MATFPEDLRFSREHVWVRLEGDSVRIGVTEYLIDKLGRILDVVLPEVGMEASGSSEIGHITGSGAGSHNLYWPVEGTVSAVNEELLSDPDLLTNDPYDEGWICEVSGVDEDEYEGLMNPTEYEYSLEEEE